ncbi:nuclear body protein SP140-like [Peromyscus leucopus]|uniref:nuclear body protein SP140-like n=1 Tax=Peromyscus leucopus TaxID=10041 RepID=UPI0018849FA1|nr:nuclear body protein SP140-like [Peromyscus leucopus]
MFKHVKENKGEIASAITKPFPFFMSLRDRGFISEQKFQTSQKKCKNLDAVGKMVYDILSDLQKKFSLPLLQVIFSTTHLKAYPDLKETMRSFLDGISMKSIQSEDGDWYTPPEFEILGGYEKSRNWQLSLRCYDRPLKFLIQNQYHEDSGAKFCCQLKMWPGPS